MLHWHTALLAKIHAQSFKLLFMTTAIWCYQEEFGFNGLCNSHSVNWRLLLALPSAPHSSPVPVNAPCRLSALHHSPHPAGLSPASPSLFSLGFRGQNWAQTSQWSLSSSQKRRLIMSLFAIMIHNKTYTFTSQTSNFIKVNQSFLIGSKVGWVWRNAPATQTLPPAFQYLFLNVDTKTYWCLNPSIPYSSGNKINYNYFTWQNTTLADHLINLFCQTSPYSNPLLEQRCMF